MLTGEFNSWLAKKRLIQLTGYSSIAIVCEAHLACSGLGKLCKFSLSRLNLVIFLTAKNDVILFK